MNVDDLLLVEYGDPVHGGGYVARPREQRVPETFWSVAGRMMMQPPPDLENTAPHPLWTLRSIEVPGFGLHLCFVVQGVGPAFGRAGASQFVFAPTSLWTPRALWDTCVAAVGPSGRLGELAPADARPLGPDAAGNLAGRVRDLLRALLARTETVRIPGTPAEAGDVITAALRVLPSPIATAHVWTTCQLRPPRPGTGPVLSGGWPSEFEARAGDAATQVSQWLERPVRAVGARVRGERDEQALEWLAAYAVRAGTDAPHPGAESLEELLDEIATHDLAPDWQDVERLLGDERGLGRLRAAPEAMRQFARHAPDRARGAVVNGRVDGTDAALVDPLLEGLAGGYGGGWAPPPAPQPVAGWHDALTRLLRRRHPDVDDLAAAVTAGLNDVDEPHSAHHLGNGTRSWLLDLGLDPGRHPDLFPFSAVLLAERLRDAGHLIRPDHDEIDAQPDPLGTLFDIANELPWDDTSSYAYLLSLAAVRGGGDHGRLLGGHDRFLGVRVPIDEVSGWVTGLDREAEAMQLPNDLRDHLLMSGVTQLDQHGRDPEVDLVRRLFELVVRDATRGSADRRIARVTAEALDAVRRRAVPAPPIKGSAGPSEVTGPSRPVERSTAGPHRDPDPSTELMPVLPEGARPRMPSPRRLITSFLGRPPADPASARPPEQAAPIGAPVSSAAGWTRSRAAPTRHRGTPGDRRPSRRAATVAAALVTLVVAIGLLFAVVRLTSEPVDPPTTSAVPVPITTAPQVPGDRNSTPATGSAPSATRERQQTSDRAPTSTVLTPTRGGRLSSPEQQRSDDQP